MFVQIFFSILCLLLIACGKPMSSDSMSLTQLKESVDAVSIEDEDSSSDGSEESELEDDDEDNDQIDLSNLSEREQLIQEVNGFGKDVTGGAGGELCRVTHLGDSGSGSFRSCVEGNDSRRWVIFDVSGEIRLESHVRVGSNKTIDGRGASITFTRRGLHVIRKNNVIFHKFTVKDVTDDDAIKIFEAEYVWVDHLTLDNAQDGLLDITVKSNYITVSWNYFTNHNKTCLMGHSTSVDDRNTYITAYNNFFFETKRRNPLVNRANVHFFNNLLRHFGDGSGGDGVRATYFAEVLVENNVFDAGTSKNAIVLNNPIYHSDAGYIKAVGNMALNGAKLLDNQPQRVFDPANFYNYTAREANANLIRDIEEGAGAGGGYY